MNYLTNYYKNLSEQLETKVRVLEAQAKALNEAMTTYGTYGGNRPARAGSVGDSGIGAGEGIPGDYNGDGRVDGADLGIALGNYGQPGYNTQSVLGNWTQPYSSAGQATYRSARAPSSGRRGGQVAGEADSYIPGAGIPGDYNGDGRVDGADLGIALGNYGNPGYNYQTTLQNWSGNMGVGGPATYRSATAPSTGRRGAQVAGESDVNVPGEGIPGDYNGDGRVDGADLGIALGNYGNPAYNQNTVLNNWTGNMGVAGQASYRSAPAPRIGRRTAGR